MADKLQHRHQQSLAVLAVLPRGLIMDRVNVVSMVGVMLPRHLLDTGSEEPRDPQEQDPKDHRRPVMTPSHAEREHAKKYSHKREPELKLVTQPRTKPEGREDRRSRGT